MANSNPPPAGQWFYIQSKSPDSNGRTYVANIEAANASPGAQIILWPLQPNFYNVLWKYENGNIVSKLTAPGIPFLVLDSSVSSANSVTLNSRTESSSQQWTFNDDGTISNQGSGFVLDIAGGVAQSWASLVVDPVGQSSASQQWSIVYPQVFVPTWSYIQSGLTEDQNNPLVVTLQEGTSNVVLSPQANSSNQLWQITQDGRILSATSGNPVMILGPQLAGQNGNYLVTAPSPAEIDPTMQWIFNDQNMFINASNGLALNVEGSSANQHTPLVTYAVQSGPPANEVWSLNPGPTLTDIMAAPPVPFITFTGDQGTAYSSICEQLGLQFGIPNFDLRSQYPMLDKDLGNYQDQLEPATWNPPGGLLVCPQGVSTSDWNSVAAQLMTELGDANDIRLLFSNYGLFDTQRDSLQNTQLSQLFTAAGMDQGSTTQQVGGTFLSVFEGVIYTGIEALPKSWPVLGNLMEAAINIGVSIANSGGGSISPNPFLGKYNQLQTELAQNFAALLTTMGNMENTILTDWGKMEATERAISSQGPGSLAWPDTENATLVNASIPGYTLSVLQMLLPAKYQIFARTSDACLSMFPPSNVPSNAQWTQNFADGTWTYYWIATPGNWSEYPSDEALNDVFLQAPAGLGIAASDFFQGLAGWGFARSYLGSCNYVTIAVTNQTPNPLNVTASPSNQLGTILGPTSQTLPPYGSVSFNTQYNSGLAINIVISDPNLGGGGQVAAIMFHQHDCVEEAGTLWADPPQLSLGYQLTTPICNPGSFHNHFGGAAQVGICLAPINPPPSN